jgi:hypothetical protein
MCELPNCDAGESTMDAPQWREDVQHEPDSARDRERESVYASVAATLRARGVELTGGEGGEQLAEVLSAVERFEAAVSEMGGDRMVNDPGSPQPQDEAFVLPHRRADESMTRYADRVLQAARRLRVGM